MASLWRFGGLKVQRLVTLVVRKVGKDELSIRSGALSYYFFLSLFPMILFLVSLAGIFAGQGTQLREHIISGLRNLAPGSASDLVSRVVARTINSSSPFKLAIGLVGALWAASNGMSAIAASLNVVHEKHESRPWWKQGLTVVALTMALGALLVVALILVLYGGKLGQVITGGSALGGVFRGAWDVAHWAISLAAMFLAYSLVYYYAPDVKERKWHWITPGAAVGIALWMLASYGFRVYLHFFNSYSATYGSLGAVIILMLWLYITGFALLIGDVLNWVIESENQKRADLQGEHAQVQQKLSAA